MSQPNNDILEIKDNNDIYKFELKQKKIIKVTDKKYGLYFVSFLFITLIILSIYDKIKDTMRWFSGSKELLTGNVVQGALKIEGYTRGNFMREIAILGNVFLLILTYFFMRSEKEIQFNDLPEHIKLQYTEVTKQKTF